MLKIRLKRAGNRNHPFYRVVVIDSRKARDSRAIEEIGYYNPLEDPAVINVDRERVDYWTERGAQATDSVRTLLRGENSEHPTRRPSANFTPAEPVEARKPKAEKTAKKKTKPAASPKTEEPKAATATAVAEAPKDEAEAKPAEAPAKTEPKAKDEPAAEPAKDEPAQDEAPAEKSE